VSHFGPQLNPAYQPSKPLSVLFRCRMILGLMGVVVVIVPYVGWAWLLHSVP
jgi:hypothetical protein